MPSWDINLRNALLRAVPSFFPTPMVAATGVLMVAAVPYVAMGLRTTAPETAAADRSAERQVVSAESARVEAKRQGRSSQLERLLLPDFVRVNRFGRLLDRPHTVALARNPNYSTQDVSVSVYGEGAVVTGRESDEGDPAGMVRSLRVWVRDGMRWQELAEAATRITSETEAARVAKGQPAPFPSPEVAFHGIDANDVPRPAASSSALEELRVAERAYRDAERIDDLTALKRYRAPEFRLVDQIGTLVQLPNSVRPIFNAVQDDMFSVRVHGYVAVVIGTLVRIGAVTNATDRIRYANVWVRRQTWQVVAEQRTPIG